jgi:hypothetical protein
MPNLSRRHLVTTAAALPALAMPAAAHAATACTLVIDIRQRLLVVVAHDEAGGGFLDRPGRREAAGQCASYVDQGLILGASASVASFSQFAARADQKARSRAFTACLAVSRALSASFR